MKVCPATVSVPVRWLALALAATPNVTDPEPLPGLPAVTVRKAAWLTAVHEHPPPAATVRLKLPPPDGTEIDVGEMLNEQGCTDARKFAVVVRVLFNARTVSV